VAVLHAIRRRRPATKRIPVSVAAVLERRGVPTVVRS
jgi:hypothetical protein